MPRISKRSRSKSAFPPNRSIFPPKEITDLALRWKSLNADGKHTEAMLVLEKIVLMSTPMFERLAQYEEYHNTVDLPTLVSAAQEKVVRWLLKWNPKKGRIFSWFSKCAKNVFLSELVRVAQYRRRYHVTGDNLERIYGAEDHESDKHDLADEFRRDLRKLYCRWSCPQERGVLCYLIECIVDQDNHDRQRAIRAASFAYGVSLDLVKFFYGWCIVALRSLHYHRIRVSLTDMDLTLMETTYTHFANLFERFTLEDLRWLMATHGGQRIRVPTIENVLKARERYKLAMEIDRGDKDPDAVMATGRRYSKSQRTAQEIYTQMMQQQIKDKTGEYPVYGDNDDRRD